MFIEIKKRIFAEGCKSIGFADCVTHLSAKTKLKKRMGGIQNLFYN